MAKFRDTITASIIGHFLSQETLSLKMWPTVKPLKFQLKKNKNIFKSAIAQLPLF